MTQIRQAVCSLCNPLRKGKIIHLPVEDFITAKIGGNSGERRMCDTAVNLAAEYRKGENSDWGPYVSYYFESFRHKHVPSNWSEDALELMYAIIGYHLEPTNYW